MGSLRVFGLNVSAFMILFKEILLLQNPVMPLRLLSACSMLGGKWVFWGWGAKCYPLACCSACTTLCDVDGAQAFSLLPSRGVGGSTQYPVIQHGYRCLWALPWHRARPITPVPLYESFPWISAGTVGAALRLLCFPHRPLGSAQNDLGPNGLC